MHNRIILIATLRLIEGQLSALTTTIRDLQQHCAATEPGMLQYDWYLSEQDNQIKVLETYTDSEAVLHHFDNYKPFSGRLAESREFVTLEVFGKASQALRQRVAKINAQHYSSLGSLNRLERND